LATLFVAFLLYLAVRIYINDKRLNRELANIQSAGDPIFIADLAPPPLPQDRDAAIVMRTIRDDVRAFNREVDRVCDDEDDAIENLTDVQLEGMGAAFAAHPDILPIIQEAVALDGYDWNVDYSKSPPSLMEKLGDDFAAHREVVHVLVLHAAVQRAHNRWDEAARVAIPILKLGSHFNRDRALVFFLGSLGLRSTAVDVANRGLRGNPVSEETQRLLHEEFARADLVGEYVDALKGERAYGIACIRQGPRPIGIPLLRRAPNLLNYLELIEANIRTAPAPYSAHQGTLIPPQSNAPDYRFAMLVQPTLEATRDAFERTRARMRAIRVLMAIVTRDDPDAPAPADLTDFGLPKDATIDPFNSQPLRVKPTSQGWVVYSVGRDLVDNGGKLDDLSDIGVAP